MRLERIILNGFKSFADKTEFTFEHPITAIVGPNGCGKSNVVDAIKWVLGEQSVKSLRSGHMADVIFSGSSSRKAMGSAQVSLIFANTSGKLAIEADEVQISRRLYRSGDSEYLINNKVCRLRDIKEMFMDTGVGAKAYSIIEQGQVEQLLNSSKSDRRAIFEEAAGISKYKAHKKEATRKLKRTEQNLLRLADILGEVQKQLRSVKLQAGKARNYLKYSERLKELQLNYSLVEFHKITTSTMKKTDTLNKTQEQFAAVAAEVSKNDALMSELGQKIIETENAINQADNSLVSVKSNIEQQMQRIEFLQSRNEELAGRKNSAGERIEKLREQKGQFIRDLEQYQEELTSSEKALDQKSGVVTELEKQIQQINTECDSLDTDLEDEKSGIIDIVRHTAQLHNELQSITVYRNNLSSQKDRLSGRAQTAKAELENLLTEKAQYQARSNDIEKVLSELEQNLNSKRSKSKQLSEQIAEQNKQLSQFKESRSALSSELTILKDMEARREGLGDTAKTILANSSTGTSFDYVQGLLAEVIATDVEYATAVEAALAGKTDALLVSSTDRLLNDKEAIERLEGRVNFICADKSGPFVDTNDMSNYSSVKGRLVEFVKYDSKYASVVWKLLGKTLLIDSVDSAKQLLKTFGGEYQFVTLSGQFINADGMVKLGPLGKAAGLISRKSRLRQLQQTIDNVTEQIAVTQTHLDRNNHTVEHLEKLCKDLRTATYEANTEKMQVGSKINILEENIKRLSQEQPLLASEIGLLEEQIAQSVQTEYNSKQKLEELETVNNERSARIEELEKRYTEQKQLQQTRSAQLTDLKVSLGQVAEQSKALKQTIASLQTQTQANENAMDVARQESQTSMEQIQQTEREILSSEAKVSELYVEKEKRQDDSKALHQEIETLIQNQKRTEQLIRDKRSEQSEVDQKINQLKIELGQLEVKEQDLLERVRDELQIELAQAYENYTESDVDWEAIKNEISELRGRIERLGNVNVDAIVEQEELETRNEFLSTQVDDLNKSKGQLQHLIMRLNKKSREKFRQTFEEIREHFQQIFRKLFGGGKADIILEDAEDILEAGIEIIARPPGKETRSISLLSGGEKTMTAIALLFSVFKTKPSPFCLLDEVDAALDEANNERFNMIIREFQKNSQFIIITHAKRTMSIADVLYGITMQTRGVSKKISVRFDKFGEVEPEPESAPAVA
ncbi:chromosome segregation protein SMC [Planctomycetota bacterium]